MTQKSLKSLDLVYREICQSLGIIGDDDGMLSLTLPGGDKLYPFTIGQKRAVLPTEKQLSLTNWESRVAIHPLLQNIPAGESPVMDKLRQRAGVYASFLISFFMSSMAALAVSGDHESLSPEEAEFLRPFSDADQKLRDAVKNIISLDANKYKGKCEVVRFSIVKGRTWEGKKRTRVTIAHFPIHEQLVAMAEQDAERVLCGVHLRQKDVRMLRAMYEKLVPELVNGSSIEVGSDSTIAPSLETLLACYEKIVSPLNADYMTLRRVLPGAEECITPLAWRDVFANLAEYLPVIRKIPMLDGNNGRGKVEDPTMPAFVPVVAPQATQHAQPQQAAQVGVDTGAISVPTAMTQVQPRAFRKLGAPVEEAQHPKKEAAADHNHQAPAHQGLRITQPYKSSVVQPYELAMKAQQEQQALLAQQMALRQQQQQAAVQDVPAGSRLINNVLYVPFVPQLGAPIPQNAVSDGAGGLLVPRTAGGMPGMMPGMQNNQMANVNDPNQVAQMLLTGQIDPSALGLDADSARMLAQNPVMLANHLNNMRGSMGMGMAAMPGQMRTPEYLRRALETSQLNAQANAAYGGMMGMGMNGQQLMRPAVHRIG